MFSKERLIVLMLLQVVGVVYLATNLSSSDPNNSLRIASIALLIAMLAIEAYVLGNRQDDLI